MSGKQDKRLRRAALGLVMSLDQAGKKIGKRELLAKEHKRSATPLPEANEEAYMHKAFESIVEEDKSDKTETYAITAINSPHTLRGIIRTIKKGLKSGMIKTSQMR